MSTHIQEPLPTLDPAACWNLLERVAAASSLRRAARLREFLMFVGTQSLKLGRHDIHEQEIGETVFGRPQSYDTGQDNIVRVSATELRKRVDAYFAAEGAAEPIVFEIPRGSYLPMFRLRQASGLSETSTAVSQSASVVTIPLAVPHYAPEPDDSGQPRPARSHLLVWLISAAAAVLALVCALLWHQTVILHQRIQVLEHQQSMSQHLPTSASHSAGPNPGTLH
jgi:hypothetical protein